MSNSITVYPRETSETINLIPSDVLSGQNSLTVLGQSVSDFPDDDQTNSLRFTLYDRTLLEETVNDVSRFHPDVLPLFLNVTDDNTNLETMESLNVELTSTKPISFSNDLSSNCFKS